MSELEDLPSWAGRSTDAPATQAQPTVERRAQSPAAATDTPASASAEPVAAAAPIAAEPKATPDGGGRKRSPLMMALLGLLAIGALFAVGLFGYMLADSQNDTSTAAGSTDADDGTDTDDGAQLGSQEVDEGSGTEADSTGDGTGSDTATGDDADNQAGAEGEDGAEGENGAESDQTVTVDVDGDENASADGDDATPTDGTDENAASDGETLSTRRAAFRGGKVYLSGAVPSEEIGQVIEERAAAVVGPDNVVNEYTIDPTVEIQPGESTPLYVEDVVLFEFNSVEIAEPFLPILDLGVLLLRQNPQASVTVITRTDAVGSEEVNLEVSRQRAEGIVDYWLARGVSADQITTDPKGEEGASESDDEATAAASRRAEFVITGLLN